MSLCPLGSACLRICACCPTPQVFRCRRSLKMQCRRTAETRMRRTPTNAYPVKNSFCVQIRNPSEPRVLFNLIPVFLTFSPHSRQEDSVRRGVLRLGGWRRRRPKKRNQLQESKESQNWRRQRGRRKGEERWGGNKRYLLIFFISPYSCHFVQLSSTFCIRSSCRVKTLFWKCDFMFL